MSKNKIYLTITFIIVFILGAGFIVLSYGNTPNPSDNTSQTTQ